MSTNKRKSDSSGNSKKERRENRREVTKDFRERSSEPGYKKHEHKNLGGFDELGGDGKPEKGDGEN